MRGRPPATLEAAVAATIEEIPITAVAAVVAIPVGVDRFGTLRRAVVDQRLGGDEVRHLVDCLRQP